MMQLEPNPSERVRVIGALMGPPLEMLLEMTQPSAAGVGNVA
jgi:hypothetical protein